MIKNYFEVWKMFINHLPEYKDNYIQYENFIAIHRDNNNIIDI